MLARHRISRLILLGATGVTAMIGAACGEPIAPEPLPSDQQGYLAVADLPNSLTLVPPAPTPGSAAQAYDLERSRLLLPLRGTPRWELAKLDADIRFPAVAGTFSCALDAPVTEGDTPALYRLLRRSLWDAGLSTYPAKDFYQRTRPFMLSGEPTCTPEMEHDLARDGSYPSGHSAVGWAWALILAEIAPDRRDQVLARGLAFGESRMACNVHWANDVMQGRTMGAAAVAVLHANSQFQADRDAARAEIAAARGRGLPPTRDCEAEARALAQPLPASTEGVAAADAGWRKRVGNQSMAPHADGAPR